MKYLQHSGLFCMIIIAGIACTGSNSTLQTELQKPDNAVGIVNGEYVSYDELKENFISGSLNNDFTEEELLEFLPIYLDYKGKLINARESGYFESEFIREEYEVYAKQASYAYWMDQEIRPTKFNQFKSRYDVELKSSHILVALDPVPSPEDTLEAYNKIVSAREELVNGASIEEVDVKYSTTRNGRSMGGALPWLSVGTTVSEFEDALYNLEVGELSKPVRTQFGYHIILLEDKRERVPARSVSHIFVRRNGDMAKLDTAYQQLIRGGQWGDVVRENTDDGPSIPNEGFIGWVDYASRYEQVFLDSVMNLDPTLPFTKPISSVYGAHIFKVDSVRGFANDEARDEYLMDLLEESNQFQTNNRFVLEYVLDEYPKSEFEDNIDQFVEYAASLDTLMYSEIIVPDSLTSLEAFVFNNTTYNINDYLLYLRDTHGDKINTQYSEVWYQRFKEFVVDSSLTNLTLDRFPEFSEQTDTYLSGLVVYQINEDSVWSASTIDSTLLMNRYESNISSYQFDQRYHYYMITSSRDSSLDRAIEFIEAGNHPDSLLANDYRVGVNSDSTGAFQGEPFTLLASMTENEISDRFTYGNRKGHFYLQAILPARTMTFDESFNRLVSEYQPIREENWLNWIRETYNIESYPEVIRASFLNEQNPE